MKKAGMPLFTVTIPTVTVLSMFVIAYTGTIILYFGWDEYRYYSGVQDKIIMLRVTIFTMISITGLVIGFIFSKFVLGFGCIKTTKINIRSLKINESILLFILFAICTLVLAVYISKIPKVAFLVALSDVGGDDVSVARSLMGNDFEGKYHRYSFFMRDLLSFVTFAFFGNWLLRKTKLTFIIFFISFITASFSSIMAVEKGPFVWLLISLFFTYIIICNRSILPLRKMLMLGACLVTVLVLFYIILMNAEDIVSTLLALFSRAFTGQIQPAYHYLEIFPAQHDFLWGRSFPNPGGILPFKSYALTVEVMNWAYPELAKIGAVGTMPTFFWGELYANFGLFGVLFSPIIVGIALYVITYYVSKLEGTPIQIALTVWLAMHYKNLALTGLSSFIFDFNMIAILGIVFMLIALTNQRNTKLMHHRDAFL